MKLNIRMLFGVTVIVLMLAGTVFADEKSDIKALDDIAAIARLESFNGGVTVKNLGKWGVQPQKNMVLYHGDKVITNETGTCRISFNDGSILDIGPNSYIRIAQIKMEQPGFTEKEVQIRDIRVLLGKVKYQSSDVSKTQTNMVSPTAVAALRGTEVVFGTDGKIAFLNQIQGSSAKKGNITEGHVPDITARQAADDAVYLAAVEADRVQREYIQKVKELAEITGRGMLQTERLLASGDEVFFNFLLAQASSAPDPMTKANQVMLIRAKNAEAIALELEKEADRLSQNPDADQKRRAEEGRKYAQKAKEMADRALKDAVETPKRIENLLTQLQKGGKPPEEIRGQFQNAIKVSRQTQEAISSLASLRGRIACHVIAGRDKKAAERENAILKKAEDAVNQMITIQSEADKMLKRITDDMALPVNERKLTDSDVNSILKAVYIQTKSNDILLSVVYAGERAVEASRTGDPNKIADTNRALNDVMDASKSAADAAQKAADAILNKPLPSNASEQLKELEQRVDDTVQSAPSVQETDIFTVSQGMQMSIPSSDTVIGTPPPDTGTPPSAGSAPAGSAPTSSGGGTVVSRDYDNDGYDDDRDCAPNDPQIPKYKPCPAGYGQ